jgi:RimJ/RimL family protein N-acetyltransferase
LIETERLRLRRPTSGDFDASYAMWSDPRVTEHIGGTPSTRQQTWIRLLSMIGHWTALPYGNFVVEEASTGAFAGEVGLFNFKRDITPPIDQFPEAGWAFSPAMQGRGYATEALQALLTWADATLEAPRIVALINEANTPSLRVAKKTGFREHVRTTFNGHPVLMFERLRPVTLHAHARALTSQRPAPSSTSPDDS